MTLYKNLLIIGAPRSGTNMLRDAICSLPGYCTWNCDEINYIWRYGNKSNKTDVLKSCDATKPIKHYIRKQFNRLACQSKLYAEYSSFYVVEKTCANCLRVDFVDEIARPQYIYIKRNPFDVVASMLKRWTAPLDPIYLLKKAKYVPISDLPYSAQNYLQTRLNRFLRRGQALSTWGPRYEGIDSDISKLSLVEVCALQWLNCVRSAEGELSRIALSRIQTVVSVDYEDLVAKPKEILTDCLAKIKAYPTSRMHSPQEFQQLISDKIGYHAPSIYGGSVKYGKSLSSQAYDAVSNVVASYSPLLIPSR